MKLFLIAVASFLSPIHLGVKFSASCSLAALSSSLRFCLLDLSKPKQILLSVFLEASAVLLSAYCFTV